MVAIFFIAPAILFLSACIAAVHYRPEIEKLFEKGE